MDATLGGVSAAYTPTFYAPPSSSGQQSATPTPSASQQGSSVLDKLDAVVQEAKAEPKQWAAQQLQEAVAETRILKALGGALTPQQQAEQATRIAKRISDASQAYASAGGSGSGSAGAAPSATSIAATIDSPATGTPAGDTSGLTVDNTANVPPQTLVQELAASPKAFFGLAAAALGVLHKIETTAVNAMEQSSDPQTRKKGQKLAQDFDKAVSDTESAAASMAQAGSGSGGTESGGTAIGTTTTTLTVEVDTVSVDITA